MPLHLHYLKTRRESSSEAEEVAMEEVAMEEVAMEEVALEMVKSSEERRVLPRAEEVRHRRKEERGHL